MNVLALLTISTLVFSLVPRANAESTGHECHRAVECAEGTLSDFSRIKKDEKDLCQLTKEDLNQCKTFCESKKAKVKTCKTIPLHDGN